MCAISHNSDVMETMDVAISAWLNQSIPWTSQLKIHCFRTFLTPRSTSNVDLCTITKTILNCHPPIETYHEIWESFKGDQGSDFKVFVLLLLSMKNSLSFFVAVAAVAFASTAAQNTPSLTMNNDRNIKWYTWKRILAFSAAFVSVFTLLLLCVCALRCAVCVCERDSVFVIIFYECARAICLHDITCMLEIVCVFFRHIAV